MKNFINLYKCTGVLLIALSIVLFWSCEDDADDENNQSDLVGTWYFTDGESSVEITTDSDQTAVLPFSEGIGSIDLSGEITTELTYMMAHEEDGEIEIMLVSQSMNLYPLFPLYVATISITGGGGSAFFVVSESEDSITIYVANSIDMSFDADNHTLTINSTDFMKIDMSTGQMDTNSVVTFNGTLQSQTVNITANMPTLIDLGEIPSGIMTMIFESNGHWLSMIPDYDGDTPIDTSAGTWEIVDGVLMIMEEVDDEGGNYIDTSVVEYTFSNNILTMNLEIDQCEEEVDYPLEDCLEEAEMEYGLDSGSLVDIVQVMVWNFSQTAPNPRILLRSRIKHPLDSIMLQHKRIWHHPF